MSNKSGVKCLQVLIVGSWCIPLLGLLLDAPNFYIFGTKREVCEAKFTTKIVMLFKINDGLVK